jgi:hypothetical protein
MELMEVPRKRRVVREYAAARPEAMAVEGLEFLVYLYHTTAMEMYPNGKHVVERVQTGVRMEKRLLKVLRAFADYRDLTLGDLLEGIVLHAFDGKCPFGKESLERLRELKRFYGLDLDSSASHLLTEAGARDGARGKRSSRPRARQ